MNPNGQKLIDLFAREEVKNGPAGDWFVAAFPDQTQQTANRAPVYVYSTVTALASGNLSNLIVAGVTLVNAGYQPVESVALRWSVIDVDKSISVAEGSTVHFKDKIAAIDTAAQQQQTPSGATDNKAAARDALEDVLFLTCEALAVLGHTTNDHDLLALTSSSLSALDRLNADELVNRATTVLERANARKTELAVLHVTQANLDELTQALQAFASAKEQPRTETAERMAQTESLSNLIREANRILRNRIDRLVNLFRRLNPDFVAGYRGARVVVDRAASHSTTPPAGGAPPPNPKP